MKALYLSRSRGRLCTATNSDPRVCDVLMWSSDRKSNYTPGHPCKKVLTIAVLYFSTMTKEKNSAHVKADGGISP